MLIEMCYYGCRNENIELNENENETETDNISNTSINSDLNNFFIVNI